VRSGVCGSIDQARYREKLLIGQFEVVARCGHSYRWAAGDRDSSMSRLASPEERRAATVVELVDGRTIGAYRIMDVPGVRELVDAFDDPGLDVRLANARRTLGTCRKVR
jgi:hypothetical protein